jgi:copper chaperone NosL
MRPELPVRPALALLFSVFSLFACGGPPGPAALDTKNDACAWCRMGASDARFAAQLVAPREEPRFFDDIGCLAAFLAARPAPKGSLAFVADHRTKAWVSAPGAVYTRNPGLQTPMSFHLLAHADAASRDADPDARGGTPESATTIFGAVRLGKR